MAREFRRVVTGHDENGKAVIVSDATASQYLERPSRPGVRLTNFWIERGSPAEYDGPTETCTGDFVLHPPPLGSTFRCVEFLPEDPDVLKTLDGKAAFGEMGRRRQCRRGWPASLHASDRFAGLRHRAHGRDLDGDGRRNGRPPVEGR